MSDASWQPGVVAALTPAAAREAATVSSVLVIDPQPMFREGVVVTLNRTADFNVVGEACSAREALSLARRLQPEVVVLSVDLPDLSGLDLIKPIQRLSPAAKIALFVGAEQSEVVVPALRAGAAACLVREVSPEELVDGVRALLEGQAYASPAIAMRFLRHANHAEELRRASGLTPRNQEILDLVAEGLTNREIGARLDMGERTVKHHIGEILRHLNTRNRVEAALVVWRRRACGNHIDCAKRKPLAVSELPVHPVSRSTISP